MNNTIQNGAINMVEKQLLDLNGLEKNETVCGE